MILFYTTHILADDNIENSNESASSQANRSTLPASHQGVNKDQTLAKKLPNRSYQESSTVINNRSASQNSQTSGNSLLMAKIIGSNKDVTEETLFLGAEIPKYGVLTNHEMELEKAIIFYFLFIPQLCYTLLFKLISLSDEIL